MKRTTRKKLVLPLIAIGMMTMVNLWDSLNRSHPAPAKAPAAARMSHTAR
jgi:hypothetical protein